MKANALQDEASWMVARAGKLTASRADKLMAKLRDGRPAASRGELLATLAVERLTGMCISTYQNAAMARGIELEAEARDAYSFHAGVAVAETGFVESQDLPNTGASPDGLIGDDGLLEIKCPANPEKHVEALRRGAHATEYRWQLQHQMLVTGRSWVEMVSFDPRFPDGLQLAITRVARDEDAIASLREEITKADAEIDALVKELTNMKEAA